MKVAVVVMLLSRSASSLRHGRPGQEGNASGRSNGWRHHLAGLGHCRHHQRLQQEVSLLLMFVHTQRCRRRHTQVFLSIFITERLNGLQSVHLKLLMPQNKLKQLVQCYHFNSIYS